jgi:hypothetical protein
MYLNTVRISIPNSESGISETVTVMNRVALLEVPIVWWRKPYGGPDGHGTSPQGRCEGGPESSEISSLGKLNVFSKSTIGAFGKSFITVLEKLETRKENVCGTLRCGII